MDIAVNLLFNLFFIMTVTSLHRFWIESKPHHPFANKTVVFIASALIIWVSMELSFFHVEGLVFDLRRVPLWFGTLYGGPLVGLGLLAEIGFIQALGGPESLLGTLINSSLVFLAAVILKPFYSRLGTAGQIAVASIVNVLFSIMVLFFHDIGRTYPLGVSLSFILTNVTGIVFVILSISVLHKNYQSRMKLNQSAKMAAISHLAASVNDQVKNPLTTVRGILQLLEYDTSLSPEKKSDFIKLAIEEIDGIDRVITDYSTLASPLTGEVKVIGTAELLNAARAEAEPIALQSGVHICDEKAEPCYILGEEKLLLQVLDNLIRNSIESMKEGGTVRLSSRCENGNCRIYVTDNGTGIAPEKLRRLGEPYFSTAEAGSGLGLTIVHKVVGNLGGEIEIKSTVGKGTEVMLTFPSVKKSAPSV